MDYTIVTDSSCNLTEQTIDEFSLEILPLRVIAGDEEYRSYLKGAHVDLQEFYAMMREGTVFTTSLPNLGEAEAQLRAILEAGQDLIYIGFSSGLSGTYAAVAALLDSLAPDYPERTVRHIDTYAASGGEGLLVYYAATMRAQGAGIDEVLQWLHDNRLRLAHWFTVDDLMFLFRGGRVSRTNAWAGTLLNIKPVMHVDDEGHLIPLEKVRGRKKSIHALLDRMKRSAREPVADQTVFITHGDCIDDANYLADLIRKEFGTADIRINYIDPVIGAHSGPGTLALFFLADER